MIFIKIATLVLVGLFNFLTSFYHDEANYITIFAL